MKRRLSSREVALLIVLLVLVLVSGYYLWFYVPMQEKQLALEGQILDAQNEIEIDKVRIARMREMEQELEEIFAADPNPVSMAAYDNIQNVMFDLNAILSVADDYTLNFTSVDTEQEDGIVRRNISLGFESGSYDAAKDILQELHDSDYRCMLDDLDIRVSEQTRGGTTFNLGTWWLDEPTPETSSVQESTPVSAVTVNVTATMVFFEYQE